MTIGLIADTHGYLDPKTKQYFDSCQEILHAGDIGTIDVLESLTRIKPTIGVYGNIDGPDIRNCCPRDLWLEREGIKILVTHIAGSPGRYNSRVNRLVHEKSPDILICGHSHILKIMKDPQYPSMLHINPGAAGRQGFHHKKTIVRLTLVDSSISNLEVIELGRRGSME